MTQTQSLNRNAAVVQLLDHMIHSIIRIHHMVYVKCTKKYKIKKYNPGEFKKKCTKKKKIKKHNPEEFKQKKQNKSGKVILINYNKLNTKRSHQ